MNQLHRNGYLLSTDKNLIDTTLVHDYLSKESYWAPGIPFETVKKSIEHSLCFGVYKSEQLVAFARVISDFSTYAYLADVFVIPAERGKGISKILMEFIVDHPQLEGLRRFVLATQDAHGLYAQFGFIPYPNPDRLMCRNTFNGYGNKK